MILKISEQKSERENRAELHRQKMGEKYSKINCFDAWNDFRCWYELASPDGSEALMKIVRRDYPLPYDLHYFQRFAELFFSRYSEDRIKETLEHEFLGDETDAEYIESLLIKAKDFGFFAPGASIEFIGTSIAWLPPPPPGTIYKYAPRKGGVREIYEGSEANKDRAKIIRRWLKQRAKELVSPAAPERSFTAIETTAVAANIDAGPFSSLLLNYSLTELTALLAELGLLSATTGRAVPAATPGAWVGVIYALLEAKPARLTGTKAAIWRAFSDTFKAEGSERAVQYGLGTRGSTAEQFKDRALDILSK